MADDAPDVITRYLQAADDKDPGTLAACFTPDGTVVDEGVTYRGHDQIVQWRKSTLAKWEYTTTVLSSQPVGAEEHRVTVHIEGNFPGGTADLTYRFTLHDQLISALSIAE